MVHSRSDLTWRDQDELKIFAGSGKNRRLVSLCNTGLTGQALGRSRTILFLYWRTWTAILNRLAITVDGCACDNAVCSNA